MTTTTASRNGTWSRLSLALGINRRGPNLPITRLEPVEIYPSGYPRFSALLASEPSLLVTRRFSSLRSRLLLLKQDKLSQLEQQLNHIDATETASLYLKCRRLDRNVERAALINDIDIALKDYDDFMARTSRMIDYGSPSKRNLANLQKWVAGNACLSREESVYLQRQDLLSLTTTDGVITTAENVVEDTLSACFPKFYARKCQGFSTDPHVLICSGHFVHYLSRTLVAAVILLVLLAPVLICNYVSVGRSRIIVIVVATSVFLALVSICLQARTIEAVLAGATYATILTVFVAGAQ